MDFQTLKEKLLEVFNSIKSKLTGKPTEEKKDNENDGMLSIDDYFASDGTSTPQTNYYNNNTPAPKVKKPFDSIKTFVNEANYNPFSDQTEVKKVDKKILKETWFMILIRIIVFCIMIFLSGLCVIMIYRLGYDLLNDTNVSNIGGYSDYLVPEGNLSPTIDENDLVIFKTLEYYEEGDIILYEFAETSHKIGKVSDIVRDYYVITDNNIKPGDYNSKIPSELVIGKEVKIIKNFKGMYNFITSPFTIVLVVVVISLYFFLISKGKIKDKEGI